VAMATNYAMAMTVSANVFRRRWYRALFDDWHCAGTDRGERLVTWPLGIESAGAMREWGSTWPPHLLDGVNRRCGSDRAALPDFAIPADKGDGAPGKACHWPPSDKVRYSTFYTEQKGVLMTPILRRRYSAGLWHFTGQHNRFAIGNIGSGRAALATSVVRTIQPLGSSSIIKRGYSCTAISWKSGTGIYRLRYSEVSATEAGLRCVSGNAVLIIQCIVKPTEQLPIGSIFTMRSRQDRFSALSGKSIREISLGVHLFRALSPADGGRGRQS